MVDKWTFKPQDDNSSYLYVQRYMAEIWKAIADWGTGRNLASNYLDYHIDYDGGYTPDRGWLKTSPPPPVGTKVGQHLIRYFQEALVESIPYYCRTDVDLKTITDPADWNWTYDTFATAIGNTYASTDPGNLFRRYADKPSFKGGTELHGYCEVGDYIGPEIWEDLSAVLKLLHKYALHADAWGAGHSHTGRSQVGGSLTWGDAVSEYTTSWNGASILPNPSSPMCQVASNSLGGPYFSIQGQKAWNNPIFGETTGLIHDAITHMPLNASYSVLIMGTTPYDSTDPHYIFESFGDNVANGTWTEATTGNWNTLFSNATEPIMDRWQVPANSFFGDVSNAPTAVQPAVGDYNVVGYQIKDCWAILDIEYPYQE